MLHKPSFVEEEEGCDSEVVWLNQRFNHPSLNLIHPVLHCVVLSEFVQHVGGDLERVVVELDSSPPHLFLYLSLLKKRKTKVETKKRTLPVLNTRESKLYLIKLRFYLEH